MKKPSIAVCAAAAIMLLTAVGCSGSREENGGSGSSSKTADVSGSGHEQAGDNENTSQTGGGETSPEADGENTAAENGGGGEASAEQFLPGEKLEKTRELFDGDYTYSVKTTFSDAPDDEISAVVARQGDKVYITYSDKGSETPDRAYWFDGTAAYDIDFGMKIYSGREQMTDYNLILTLIDNAPERTEGHPRADMDEYTVEEYTYAGDTYITVFDFYFDENDELKKYDVTYTVEGEDELIQSCEVLSIETAAEQESDPLEGLTDFDAMTEDERLGFCQTVCGEKGISTDNMYEMNITTDDLKRIDYETFTELVYTYGK